MVGRESYGRESYAALESTIAARGRSTKRRDAKGATDVLAVDRTLGIEVDTVEATGGAVPEGPVPGLVGVALGVLERSDIIARKVLLPGQSALI